MTSSNKPPKIEKYEFKTIQDLEKPDPVNEVKPLDIEINNFGKELVDTLLAKVDVLSSSLASMQINLKNQEASLNEKLELTRSESYKSGFEDGANKIKTELEEKLEKERQSLINSISNLEGFAQSAQKKLDLIEQDLGEIALKLAKEVIVKEVEQHSSKIALELAKSLISGIKEAININLKINPEDYVFLKENLQLSNVVLEASSAVQKGGVVLSCALGEMQGDLNKRFLALKESFND